MAMEKQLKNRTNFPIDPLVEVCHRESTEWLASKEKTQFAECCGQFLWRTKLEQYSLVYKSLDYL
ncbi:hypothetical protein BLA29_000869 [Euroglyphus maynei]|uniref:Uncharacterized protein n=1 Tax=Euroglyphus maynei TaxID=6958 RepID=A0A1Y3BQH0_EURMA|nr:hypothetical protein BLA29_000869 [Euroglyphus maynei]